MIARLAGLRLLVCFGIISFLGCSGENHGFREQPVPELPQVQTGTTTDPVRSSLFETCHYAPSIAAASAEDRDGVFKLIEDHEYDSSRWDESSDGYPGGDLPNKLSSVAPTCRSECNDLSIQTVYESFLAKNVMQSELLNTYIGNVFHKVFTSMSNRYRHSFRASLHDWARLSSKVDGNRLHMDETGFPVAQKYKMFLRSEKFNSKERFVKWRIGQGVDNFDESISSPDAALQLDYLMFNAKNSNKKATDQLGLPGEFQMQRDYFFNAIMRRLRGYRGNKAQAVNRKQIGIVKFDIPELDLGDEAYAWRHWARDSCINDPQSSLYSKSVTDIQLPLSCGISGSANLAIWSLLAYGTELDENEMRLYLLSVWATLCADGGHSLQEVLTSAKLNAIYIKGLIAHNPEFRSAISEMTLNSLIAVTKGVNPLGVMSRLPSEQEEALIRRVEDRMYRRVYREVPQPEEKHLSEDEKSIRFELEYYFTHVDVEPIATFGKYNEAFFSKIEEPAFRQAVERAQEEVSHYVRTSCPGTRE